MALFIPGGVLHIMTYMGRLCAKGVPFFRLQVYTHDRVGKCVISVNKKAQKD